MTALIIENVVVYTAIIVGMFVWIKDPANPNRKGK